MQYLLLLHSDPGFWSSRSADQMSAIMEDHNTLIDELKAGGKFLGAEPLVRDAITTVRVRDGKSDVVDGPFAETKDLLAGFYFVDVADLDEALAVAARIPDAHVGGVEIRPIMQLSVPGRDAAQEVTS